MRPGANQILWLAVINFRLSMSRS